MKITSYEVIKYAEKMSEGLPQYTAKQVFIVVISSIGFDNAVT